MDIGRRRVEAMEQTIARERIALDAVRGREAALRAENARLAAVRDAAEAFADLLSMPWAYPNGHDDDCGLDPDTDGCTCGHDLMTEQADRSKDLVAALDALSDPSPSEGER
jgi:hypothetical protein